MKIAKQTQNLMVFKNSKIVHLIIGVFLVVIGMALFFYPGLEEEASIIMPIIFFTIGLAVILLTKRIEVYLDKNKNQAIVNKKSIISKEKKKYNINEIKQIELQQRRVKRVSKERQRTKIKYDLVFILEDSDKITLCTSSKISIMGFSFNKKIIRLGKKISNFLEVPFKQRRAPSVSETISAIKDSVSEQMEDK